MLGIPTFLSWLTLVTSVHGSLYPTYPVASTTWHGGRTECVTWIDNGEHPNLNVLGKLDVDLYVNGHTRVSTLGTNVSPESKFLKFKVIPSWGPDAHNYHVRFVSHEPPVTYYSADFSISDMDYNSTSAFTAASLQHKQHDHAAEQKLSVNDANSTNSKSTHTTSVSLYTPVMTLVLPDTTIVSTLAPTTPRPTPSSSPSQIAAAAVTATPAVVIDPNADLDGGEIPRGVPRGGVGGRKSGSAGASNRRVDMEKLKFRVVFILWPVLIGVSMAL